ncbi:Rad2 nuclease [Vermiconidia calcicola]|uniref:Rad2 nuclease n=1 Tax=Vermiconidia calcicola TaxID=1690605 RepID=A0ACC3NPV7_9PEZI|nr:Rad2 nuclease [Vermiconidia calcicola]
MGIQGLLPLLKSIHKPTHLRNFAGQTLGVDAYGWLHRGTVSCAIELAQQKPTRKHIDFALSRVRMLLHFGVKPYIVFDGDYLPSKEHTEKERAARRKESKRVGLDLLRMGRISQAHLELQKAVDVTPSMARELIEELKRLDVPYVVAPYEADSQLAYLEQQGMISGVLSEDSDLLVFGVSCLLTKLDQYGECVMVNRADFTACREVSLVGWTDKEFRIMAMLSGCDYLPGIDKMGLKTAYRLVRKHKVIERIVRTVQFDGKMKVPAGYLDAFTKAERTFLYQWVFCPEAQCLINLNKVPAELNVEDMPYIGKQVDAEIALGVAMGDLDPNTKKPIIVSSRLANQATARTRVVQTPDEKQGKPISEFFKPKRTPLAELDPNSFTPSPSQQRLLEDQRRLSWSASQAQVSRPPALNRVATVDGPSSAPQATRRAISNQWPDRQRASPKRQRLCSDSMLAASMNGAVGLETATSRFFSKQPVQPSPSLRKASARKKDDFELWSDDSVAEAAAAMTATPEHVPTEKTPSPKKRKKLQVYADPEPVELGLRADSVGTSQSTVATAGDSSTQRADVETPTTSFETEESQSETTVFSKGVNASFAAFKSKYSYQSRSPTNKGLRTKSTPMVQKSPLQEAERNGILGRLGNSMPPSEKLDNRRDPELCEFDSQAPEEVDVVRASSPIAAPQTAKGQDNNEDTIGDEEWLAMEQREASPTKQPVLRGSEDFLVPESPESVDDDGRTKPKLDLARFAFAT